MKLVSKIFAVLIGLSQLPSVAASYAELVTQNNLTSFSDNWNSLLYVNTSIKINDRYSVTPELLTAFQYTKGGQGKFDANHGYLRVYLQDRGLAKIGSWKVGMRYRYALPTPSSVQRQGSYGSVMFRPDFSNKWGRFSMLIRPYLTFHLQRNAYQLNPADRTKPAPGNPLLQYGVEIIPNYDITDELSFSFLWLPNGSYTMHAGGATDGTSTMNFAHEYELGYTSPKIADFTIAVGFGSVTSAFNAPTFSFATKAGSYYYLKLARQF